MRVLKFGGKSLDTRKKVQKICKYIKKIYENDKKLVIVVSAMGNLTSTLTSYAKSFGYNEKSKRELAILLSTGETISGALVSMCLENLGVPAKSFSGRDIELTTFGDYLNGKVAYLNKTKILDCFSEGKVAVVCGFQGINKSGEITTLGLGGSDTTATALACAFSVPAEIYSDYEGVFSGDPRILPFKKLNKIDYSSMILMSKAGAKVLDENAVSLAKNNNVVIISKSSNLPQKSGSIISEISSDFISICTCEKLNKVSIIFSNESKLNFICKVILQCLNDVKFYDMKIESKNISFYVPIDCSNKIIGIISEKLKLIK